MQFLKHSTFATLKPNTPYDTTPLSDLPFRSYKAINIPQNGLHTYIHTRVHPGFQNTGIAIARPARPVLKMSQIVR